MFDRSQSPEVHTLADFVDRAVKDIDGRLDELKQEVQRLEAARSALLGGRRAPGRPRASAASSSAAPARRRATRTARAGRPRGRRGGNTRANQALQLVKDKPGITIPEIASALKIEPNYLYRVMPKLVEDGSVRREGQGWHPASGGAGA